MQRMHRRNDKVGNHCETDKQCFIHLWTSIYSFLGFGHIALELPNDAYISFWPAAGTGKFEIKHEQCKCTFYGSFSDEVKEKGQPATSVEIVNLDISTVAEWLEKFKEEDPDYHVWSQNCAIVVFKALRKGNPWFRKFNHVKRPCDVYKIVTEGYNKSQNISQVPAYCQYLLLCIAWYFLQSLYQSHKYVIKPIFLTVCKCLQETARFCWYVIYVLYQKFLAYNSATSLTDTDRSSHSLSVDISGIADSKIVHTSEYVSPSSPRNVTTETEEPDETDYYNIGGTEVELDYPNL